MVLRSLDFIWNTWLVYKSQLGMIIMANISKSYENGLSYPLKEAKRFPVTCYKNLKTAEMVLSYLYRAAEVNLDWSNNNDGPNYG